MKNKVTTNLAGMDVIDLILEDHVRLKELIETLKDADMEREEKEAPYEEFALLLINHAKAEEKSLYVKMKKFENLTIESYEGDTEHSIAEQLVQKINATANDDEWTAKVKVLAELVEHHIEEEENEMFDEIKDEMDIETRKQIGAEYIKLKGEFDALSMHKPSSQTDYFHPSLMQ